MKRGKIEREKAKRKGWKISVHEREGIVCFNVRSIGTEEISSKSIATGLSLFLTNELFGGPDQHLGRLRMQRNTKKSQLKPIPQPCVVHPRVFGAVR